MMKKALLTIATLAFATMVSGTASAQDTSAVKAGVGKPTFEHLVAAINATSATTNARSSRVRFT